MLRIAVGAVVVLFAVVLAGPAWGDEIELHDGRVLEGRLRSQTPGTVIFEVHSHGIVAEMTFRMSEVRKITRKPFEPKAPEPTIAPPRPVAVKPAPEPVVEEDHTGPRYVLVPIKGVIGKEVVAAKLKETLEKGLTNSETVLVLEVDSPGGLVKDCEEIIKLLSDYRDRRTIAHIKSAFSAAAMISMTCKEIYMHSTASIGAATAVQNTPWGQMEVGEKYQSVWRAMCRLAAEIGDHNPLIAEAMVDSGMRLKIVQKDGKPVVEQANRFSDSDEILVASGRLLTMTAREAVRSGLAVGVADTLAKVGESAGLSGWKQLGKFGEDIMGGYAKEITGAEALVDKYKEDFEKAMNIAEANSPMRGRYMYDELGRFTPDSRAEYLRRSKRVVEALRGAEDRCEKIMAIAEKYPFFSQVGEEAKALKMRVEAFRKDMQESARRMGL